MATGTKRDGGRAETERRKTQRASSRPTKKDQIVSLYLTGMGEIEDIAMITGARPSYVGSVLQEAGLTSNYFDLYTSTSHPMNVYSKFYAGKLGFKDEETARQSLLLIDRTHRQFDLAGDRAGQHHALVMALTMFDRARFTGKLREAAVFRDWLSARLDEADLEPREEDEEDEPYDGSEENAV